MEQKQNNKNFDLPLPFKWLILIVVYFGILYYLLSKFISPFRLLKTKYSKQELAKHFGVAKKTFNKWSVFWKNPYDILDDYPRRKLLNIVEVSFIMYKLGDPDEFPVMTKKQIIEESEGSYKSLRSSVKKYPEHFGITYEDFSRMDKFPPSISKKIKDQYD